MDEQRTGSSFNPFSSVLRRLGRLADTGSREGRAFKRLEEKATRAFLKVAGNNAYLNMVGRSMELSFLMRSQLNLNLETLWHLWRIPTSSDIDDVREQLHDLHAEVEALSSQLEYLIEQLRVARVDRDPRFSSMPSDAWARPTEILDGSRATESDNPPRPRARGKGGVQS